MQKYLLFLSFFVLLQNNISAQNTDIIIPKPNALIVRDGVFDMSRKTLISTQSGKWSTMAKLFHDELSQYIDNELVEKCKKSKKTNQITFVNGKLALEGYILNIKKDNIEIEAASEAGYFYALQTLAQLMADAQKNSSALKCMTVTDEPRFSYRGVHLDVSRHFFPTSYIKKYIDVLALHKINTFHWHLTDDQGWRIEIKKYPKLTEIGGFRKETLIGHYSDKPVQYDGKRYGGFYTQAEIKEIVAYASSKYVTIIPEIEMPGHSLAALSAYPELACTKGPFEAATTWGVFEDVYCTKDQTFTFMENVLSEVMELFPSQYIHIGGDECPKERWKACPNCQAKMKAEKLKNEEELQSYFIRRIEKFVNSKGKNIIGWDEILEGGIAPNATIMSWRGTEGGIAAAKQGHKAIMTPGSHCYFDHYQSASTDEPTAIGGLTTIDKVYAYEPVPQGLTPAEEKNILGAQANMWTEYMAAESQVEYMLLPRLAAMSEVLWTKASNRNWDNFAKRLPTFIDLLEQRNYNVSKRFFDVQAKTTLTKDGDLEINLFSNQPNVQFVYRKRPLEMHTDPQAKYAYDAILEEADGPVVLNSPTDFQAWIKNKDVKSNLIYKLDFYKHLAVGKPITLKESPSKSYPGENGAATLLNGQKGGRKFNGKSWLGFGNGKNMEADIDLGEAKSVQQLTIGTINDTSNWIHLPKSVSVLGSKDGVDFIPIAKTEKGDIKAESNDIVLPLEVKKFRYFRVIVENHGTIEAGFPGAGSGSWLFVDELIFE